MLEYRNVDGFALKSNSEKKNANTHNVQKPTIPPPPTPGDKGGSKTVAAKNPKYFT